MLSKINMAVGLTLCIGLGVAFAMEWKAPSLGMSGGSGSSSGRSFFFHSSGGGFHFGK